MTDNAEQAARMRAMWSAVTLWANSRDREVTHEKQ
jgi:hypothetical protein